MLNAIWTPLFFGAGQYGLAFADLVVLWLLIGATVVTFWPVHRPAAVLLLPYWAWVTYAGALNPGDLAAQPLSVPKVAPHLPKGPVVTAR